MDQAKIPVDLIMASLTEDVEKAQQRVKKAQDILLGPLDTEIAQTPSEIVYREDRVTLRHYLPLAPSKTRLRTPVLFVYALVNRETMLDLQPGKSVVENLLKEGIDLYMIDWGYPSRKDRYLDVDDHVNGYLHNMVDFIRQAHSLTKINLMGACMGGTFSVMYSALHPEKVKNLITTVTPTSFDTDKSLLNQWVRGIDVDQLVDSYGNIPGDLLNVLFLLLNPPRLMLDKYVGFFENVDNKEFVENFIRMEKWIFDSPDIPGETFRQFIKDCFQENLLIKNKLKLGERRVDLKKITMPVLNIYGEYDHLVPPEACEMLPQKVGSKDVENVCLKTGHIGIYVSSKCQRELAPKIGRWLKARDAVEEDLPAAGAETPSKRSSTKTRKKTTATQSKST